MACGAPAVAAISAVALFAVAGVAAVAFASIGAISASSSFSAQAVFVPWYAAGGMLLSEVSARHTRAEI